ncbi:tryptophan halogenase family protein [uncultured Sphingomonas sp.]|uniref:tryptophan halogenase family protein n=1 Tax=uncultured Sphingomonas sp. TaxID=158754 RepID=UPI0025D5D487|nr:tryptophan halogenase family protein [uncultured Sphingomonas sp.]
MRAAGQPIRSILIVGGGTAGWMAAALLERLLDRQPVTITLLESPDIRTVGVGEATVPAIRDYFRAIGVTEADVLREAKGTAKLGIEFCDWARPGHRFFHPFGLYGIASRGVGFHHYWLKRRMAGDTTPLADFCLATQMAMRDLMMPLAENPPNDLGVFDWAVQFDAGLFARFLARVATARGVRHVEGTVASVQQEGESGFLTGVTLADGSRIEADLFLDCTGFRSLLLGQTLGVPTVDWTHLLPCDRAVAMPCTHGDAFTPYTRSTALAAGWQWRIPLQHRVGNGYVYASAHISDDEAQAVLRGRLEGEALAEPNFLRFTTGHRARLWEKNVVAIGLSAGFLEPLESTSLTLIQSGVERLGTLMPDRGFAPELAEEFNRITALEYARIRDFLLLHYWANDRVGEPMWDAARALTLPEELAHKVSLFRSRGVFARYEWESFRDPSWLSMYAGFDLLPARHDPLADHFTDAELEGAFARMREAIGRAMALARPHQEYLQAIGGWAG